MSRQPKLTTTSFPPPPVDVFFIGEEKGDRTRVIADFTKELDRQEISHRLILIPKKRHGFKKSKTSYMAYSEVIHNIKSCKAILELISDGQTGITQRPYEAMYYGKKLITNNREVMQYSFYTTEQFFILGERPIHELKAFLQQKMLSLIRSGNKAILLSDGCKALPDDNQQA